MNYIDPTFNGAQSLKLNTRAEDGDTIVWKMTKEGDDNASITFSSPDVNAILNSGSYYQELIVDFTALGITLENETWYALKGLVGSSVVYRGRILSTDKDIENFSLNEGKYTQNTNDNEFIILQ